MYSTIPMSSDVEELLPGVKVFGSQVTLSPRKEPVAVNWQADWERLHEVWQGKSKAEVASEPRIAAYIKFSASIGLNPKQTPPSIQNIIQRFLIRDTMDRFPAIHPIVDAVNLTAVEYLVPLGVFDAESIERTMSLALTEGVETFHPLGAQPTTLPPRTLVLRDEKKVLSQFSYRDSEAQKVTSRTHGIWVLGCQVPGVDEARVTQSLDRALELIQRNYEVSETGHQ